MVAFEVAKTWHMQLVKCFQRINQLLADGGVPLLLIDVVQIGIQQFLPVLVGAFGQIVVVDWFGGAEPTALQVKVRHLLYLLRKKAQETGELQHEIEVEIVFTGNAFVHGLDGLHQVLEQMVIGLLFAQRLGQ